MKKLEHLFNIFEATIIYKHAKDCSFRCLTTSDYWGKPNTSVLNIIYLTVLTDESVSEDPEAKVSTSERELTSASAQINHHVSSLDWIAFSVDGRCNCELSIAVNIVGSVALGCTNSSCDRLDLVGRSNYVARAFKQQIRLVVKLDLYRCQ